jgi:predicted Zn-dependent protease
MSHSREGAEGRAPADRWDRFAERRWALAFEWVDGRVQQVHEGARRGCGVRNRGTDGAIRFTTIDGDERGWDWTEADAEGSWTRSTRDPSRDEETLREEHRAALGFLSELREGLAAEVRTTVRLSADVHLYRQRVLHEAADRRVLDTRLGAWMEVRCEVPDHGRRTLRLAGESIAGIHERGAAYDVGRDLGREYLQTKTRAVPAGGVHQVVFEAGGCEALLHEIGHLFEGEVPAGLARWKAGARVASSQVTIVDDPARLRAGRGSYRYDDEGTPPRKTVLVDRGRVADRIEGGSAWGDRPENNTGHARRASYRDLPQPRMACTVLEPGTEEPHAILQDTTAGILVRRLGTGSVDPESGRVTLSVTEGFVIEKGDITRPIMPSFLVFDVGSLLGAIDAVGSDLTFDHGATNCVKADQLLPVIVGLPTIRIGLIRVISPHS